MSTLEWRSKSGVSSLPMRLERALGALALVTAVACAPGEPSSGEGSASALAATPPPADVIVYGKLPATFRDGTTPFVANGGIFEHRQQTDDPLTRLKFRDVPGLVNHLGLYPDRIGSFGKYVFLGNSQTPSIGGNPVDSTVGVFDSEAKSFCSLVISPTYPASTNNLLTANPRSRKSRIIFASGTKAGVAAGPLEPALSYALADLDAANPCAWQMVRVTAPQLNAGFPEGEQICPGNFCIFDSMALLAHEDVAGDPYGRDWVVLGEYFNPHLAVVRIDASGATVVDTFTNPMFAAPGGACYKGGAARRPSSDFRLPDTRPANDWRVLFSYDAFLQETYASTPPAQCAAPQPYCPLDVAPDGLKGKACTGSCMQRYCAKDPGQACSSDSTCLDRTYGIVPVGPCVNSCLLRAPVARCQTSTGGGSHRECLRGAPDQCVQNEGCTTTAPAISGPSQEYRFNRSTNTLSPTSPLFYSPGDTPAQYPGVTPTSNFYDSERSVWVQSGRRGHPSLYRVKSSGQTCTINGQSVSAPAGERCYYNLANQLVATIVTPDQVFPELDAERTQEIPYLATTAELDGRMYIADTGTVRYAQQYGVWFPAAANEYKVDLGFAAGYVRPTAANPSPPVLTNALPASLKRCSALNHLRACNTDADCGSNGGTCTAPRRCSGAAYRACNANSDCAAGTTCLPPDAEFGQNLGSAFKFVEAGGAPTSLWVTSGYYQAPPVAQSDLFLVRVPAATALTENLSLVRPAIAWDGNRLWLVAEQGGSLRYRVRDDGQWSAWFTLGTNNITPAGGAAVIAGSGGVRLYARDASGRVHEKRLTSSATCTAGSCAWSSWVALPVRATNDDIAATYAGTQRLVAVRGTDDRVYAILGGTTWGSWFVVGSLLTNGAPSVTHHGPDGRVWIAARQRNTGVLHSTRITPSTQAVETWTAIPAANGAPASWGAAPAVVSDGQAVRLFAVGSGFPQWVWQSANDGSGWSVWRKPIGGSWGTRQPAAANINGEIDLLTYWYTGGMQHASLP
ncbi:MAG TPA: hypothetical protein VI072_17825 [Polyangiaceae bacterium]